MVKHLSLFCALIFLSATALVAQNHAFYTVFFENNSHALNQPATQVLDSVIQKLNNYSTYSITLEGHTDDVGTDGYNRSLSERRVSTVKDYLLVNGIQASAFKTNAYGETMPAIPNSNNDKRARNRRVEIYIDGEIKKQPFSTNTSEGSGAAAMQAAAKTQPSATVILPYGTSTAGGYNFTVITTTAQMQQYGFTTMTLDNDYLSSNLIICWTARTDTPPADTPFVVHVPVSNNPFCRPVDAQYFDAVNDTATGQINWKEIATDWKIDTINGLEYFAIIVTPASRRPCKNIDCKKPVYYDTLRLTTNRYYITEVKVIYEKANALMLAKKSGDRNWRVPFFNVNVNAPEPLLRIKLQDRKGRERVWNIRASFLGHGKKNKTLLITRRHARAVFR